MLKKLLLALLCAMAALVAATPAHSAEKGAIVVRVTSVEFLPPAGDCLFGAVSPLQPIRGSAGTLEVCIKTFNLGCNGRCQTLTGTATWSFPTGQIFTEIRIVEFFLDESTTVALWSGRITGGTGEYAGATGALRGGGRIVFGPAGPEPDLIFALVIA